jgi:hypothetical protein
VAPLNPKRGGLSVFPTLPKEVHGTQILPARLDDTRPTSRTAAVCIVVKRALKVLLECLDFAPLRLSLGESPFNTHNPANR